jgi:hypothetical protein
MRSWKKKAVALGLAVVLSVLCTGCLSFLGPDFIEVTATEETFENRYYYACLNEEEQLMYKEIYQGLNEQLDKFYIHCEDGDESNRVFYMVLMDFPELFWPDGNVVSTAYNESYTSVEAEYNCTIEEKQRKQAEIERAVGEIQAQIPENYGEYEKIKFVYEYLVHTVDYVEDAPDNQNMYSALVNRQSVCAGYAKATQYLLNHMDIFCTYVIGEATTDGKTDAHAWNIVQCDGKYYYVDTTWADPLFMQSDVEVKEEMVYDYLCCSESTIANTHKADDQYEYPVCDSEDLNYYRLNGMYYESANKKELRNVLYRSIDAKAEHTIFKFANKEVYNTAKDLLVNSLLSDATSYLGRKYRIYEVVCYYGEDVKLNKFIVYWNYQ